jgi:hypothetical protein
MLDTSLVEVPLRASERLVMEEPAVQVPPVVWTKPAIISLSGPVVSTDGELGVVVDTADAPRAATSSTALDETYTVAIVEAAVP